MSSSLEFVAVVFVLACLVAAYFLRRTNHRPRVRPPPRSKRIECSYQETNALANLFLEAVALKEGGASWPSVLQRLNPEAEPHIRTLLLEIREPNGTDPRMALEAIETVCIESKRKGDQLSRADLLERAKSMLAAKPQ